MGICCSKTPPPKCSSPSPIPDPPIQNNPSNQNLNKKAPEKEEKETKPVVVAKKETVMMAIPIIKPRKSHEKIDRQKPNEENSKKSDPIIITSPIPNPTGENTDSGTGNSNSRTGNSNFMNNGGVIVRTSSCTKEEVDAILIQCGRLSRSSSTAVSGTQKYSGSKRSFDFDNDDVAVKDREHDRESRGQSRPSPNRRRTPSREREREKNGRRVSRSPSKRSESPVTSGPGKGPDTRPGKLVSVPAMEGPASGVKRVAAKRSAAASPSRRSRSPGGRGGSNNNGREQNQQQISRSNSRKAEHSPYRRNPLGEIDQNAVGNNAVVTQQKQGNENAKNTRTKTKEPPSHPVEEHATKVVVVQQQMNNNNFATVNVVVPETLKQPQAAITRTRSSRLSRDLDNLNLDTQNPSPPSSSYTALLLEDIQNFHNKNPVPLPACLSKACSILEAVENLNSSNNVGPTTEKFSFPFEESEVICTNDLIEPSFHKYVTVKRGDLEKEAEREEEKEEESSGSNSFVAGGGPQQWISSSLWETNSTDSTDCWASSSRSNTRVDDKKGLGQKKREFDQRKKQGRDGFGKGHHSRPTTTTATI